ncbi:MAG: DNA starvation/stationary phase protection protein Dps [Nevskia sp.]
MDKYSTHIDIPADRRKPVIDLINQQLIDTLDLYTQTKQAHWNVKGPNFIALHELFDKLAEESEDYIDDLAERATALGGVAVGTAREVAKKSRLPEIALGGLPGMDAVTALVERYALLAASTRKAIETSATLGDADTSDLFTGISRGLDKSLWFLEAHLQG